MVYSTSMRRACLIVVLIALAAACRGSGQRCHAPIPPHPSHVPDLPSDGPSGACEEQPDAGPADADGSARSEADGHVDTDGSDT